MINPIPDDRPRVSTYLCVDSAAEAIGFYTSVLGFTEQRRMEFGGRVGHCELALGDSLLMLSDEFPEMGVVGPKTLGGTPMSMQRLRRGLRRHVRGCYGSRRHRVASGRAPVLRRPVRTVRGSVGPPLERDNPC